MNANVYCYNVIPARRGADRARHMAAGTLWFSFAYTLRQGFHMITGRRICQFSRRWTNGGNLLSNEKLMASSRS